VQKKCNSLQSGWNFKDCPVVQITLLGYYTINYAYADNSVSEIWPVMCLVNEWLCTAVTIEWMTQPIHPPSRDYLLPIWRNITFHLRQTDSNWVSEQISVQRRAGRMTVPSPSKAQEGERRDWVIDTGVGGVATWHLLKQGWWPHRQTEEQNWILIAILHLHYMQRGKNHLTFLMRET